MNYVVSTEKSLKHWLKKKVTITTGTVVGFLIMGTIAFGEIQSTTVTTNKDYVCRYGNSINIVIEKEDIQAKGIEIKGNNERATTENKGSINIQGEKHYAKGIHTI